ncbi:MAG TPA: class I SAM-dependent methyltransferase [bacterium]|nr:class I SAM-dependent methyltransferase [bacterium]
MQETIEQQHQQTRDNFRSWNERMVAKHNPEAYHQKSHWLIQWIERRRVKAILETVGKRMEGKILEVGCGAGNVLEKTDYAKLVGIDLSVSMVRRTKERLKDKPVSVLQANGEFLPFCEGSFDAIICTEVLEHVENPDRLLQEICRTAKPGARIAISVPNEIFINRVKDSILSLHLDHLLFRGGYSVPEHMEDEWHLHIFDLKTLHKKLSDVFDVEKVTAIPFSFFPIRYVFTCLPRNYRSA